MSTVDSGFVAEQRVLLGNVAWSTYEALAEQSGNPRGRMAYDQGVLEIMSPSKVHESVKGLIGRMIEFYTFEKGIVVGSVGSTTFKLSKREKGFEADESYYIQNAATMQGIDEVDLTVHPVPDLVVEVDISRSSAIRMKVFAGLNVNEVWRYDGNGLAVNVLRGGQYEPVGKSVALSGFPVALANQLLRRRAEMNENELIREFLNGVRHQDG